MKIVKNVKDQLIENIITEEEKSTDLGVIDNLETASMAEIADEVKKVNTEAGNKISNSEATQAAKEIDKYADEFKQLVITADGKTENNTLRKILKRSLDTAIRQKNAGIQADYPNILVYGIQGIGKTAIPKQFCADYGIKLVYIKASSLTAESIRGIPFPKKLTDAEGKDEYIQVQVGDPRWNNLLHPCIIFLDEYNRANPKTTDYLLGLINEHTLPRTLITQDSESGEYKIDDQIFYPNILFTIAAMNPRTEAFRKTVEPLDPAQYGRFAYMVELKADPKDWIEHVEKSYNKILSIPDLPEKDRAIYEGQLNLARALVDNGLEFNTLDDANAAYALQIQTGIPYQNLVPRTLSMLLAQSNGKKNDFLQIVRNFSGLRPEDISHIKSLLQNYTDKVTVGNAVFDSNNSERQNQASREAAQLLNDFLDGIEI